MSAKYPLARVKDDSTSTLAGQVVEVHGEIKATGEPVIKRQGRGGGLFWIDPADLVEVDQ